MQANKTLFFAIIGGAVLAVALMFAAVAWLRSSGTELTPPPQKIDIEVVAAPGLKDWVNQAANDFNASQTNITARVSEATELVPSSKFQTAAAWIPEATFVAASAGRNFAGGDSVASTGLAWGAYSDKLAAFQQAYGELNWNNLHAKATSAEGLKLIIDSPRTSGAGLAALASAAAAQQNANQLTEANVGAATTWLTETLGNNNAQARAEAAATLASVQGRSIADVGLLPLAAWRRVKLDQSDQFTVLPAQPAVSLDYPFVIVTNNTEAQSAAAAFKDFLLKPEQQAKLAGWGFDAAGAVSGGVQLDEAAAQRLRSWADVTLR